MNSAQFLSLTPHRGVVCFPNYLDSKAHDGHPKSLSRHRGPGLTGQLAERGAQPTILRDILCGDHTCGDRTWSCELDARMMPKTLFSLQRIAVEHPPSAGCISHHCLLNGLRNML